MSEHPAVAFLLAAHQRAEQAARGLPPGPWRWVQQDGDHEWESLAGADGMAVLASGDAESYQSWVWKHDGFAAFLPLMQPQAVLRRIAADREQLAEHGDEDGECRVCAGEFEIGGDTFLGHEPWPCRTVLLLAKSWGWEEAS